ncbi:MAG: alpha/beta hydrolase [Gammaproteobacteria bacterium]
MATSWQAQALGFAARTFVKPVVARVKFTPRLMKFSQLGFDALTMVLPVPRNAEIVPVHADDVPCEWVLCADGIHQDRVFIYLHGGGYFFGSARSHRGLTWRISQAGRMKVLAVDYRQPPDHQYPTPIWDVVRVYRWLLARGYEPQNIFIGGDSAGGNLSLVSMLKFRELGLPLPAGAVLISPWADLSATGESLHDNADHDPYIPVNVLKFLARVYAGDHSPRDPFLSPIYADYTGFPPILVQVGSREVLLSDAERVAEAARRAGVPVKLTVYENMMHVFQAMAYFIPEGKEAVREIGRFIHKHVGREADHPVDVIPLRGKKK